MQKKRNFHLVVTVYEKNYQRWYDILSILYHTIALHLLHAAQQGHRAGRADKRVGPQRFLHVAALRATEHRNNLCVVCGSEKIR